MLHAALAALLLAAAPDPALDAAAARAEAALVSRHGPGQRARIRRGLAQMRAQWQPADGGPDAFAAFAEKTFVPEGPALDATFARFEEALEQLDGHVVEMNRFLARHQVLDIGPTVA